MQLRLLWPRDNSWGNLRRRPLLLIFDEATSNLDVATAETFAQTVNQLKGKVTMLFIAHQIPRGLQVDEVVQFGGGRVARDVPSSAVKQTSTHMSVIEKERA